MKRVTFEDVKSEVETMSDDNPYKELVLASFKGIEHFESRKGWKPMSKTKRKLKPLEYRDLCWTCRMEYEDAGIPIRESSNKKRRRCEKCRRQGNEYIVY